RVPGGTCLTEPSGRRKFGMGETSLNWSENTPLQRVYHKSDTRSRDDVRLARREYPTTCRRPRRRWKSRPPDALGPGQAPCGSSVGRISNPAAAARPDWKSGLRTRALEPAVQAVKSA